MESIIELFENAKKKGLEAVVFMAEGTIQAFPKIERLAKKYASDNFKVIYGMKASKKRYIISFLRCMEVFCRSR